MFYQIDTFFVWNCTTVLRKVWAKMRHNWTPVELCLHRWKVRVVKLASFRRVASGGAMPPRFSLLPPRFSFLSPDFFVPPRYFFGRKKLVFLGEKSVKICDFGQKKPSDFGENLFFLEITCFWSENLWFRPEFLRKTFAPLILFLPPPPPISQNWRRPWLVWHFQINLTCKKLISAL